MAIYITSLCRLSHLEQFPGLIATFCRLEVDITLLEHAKFKFDVYSLETFGIEHELGTYILGLKNAEKSFA